MIELTSRNNVKLFRTPKQAYSYLNCTKSVFFKAIDRGKEINGHIITRTKKYLVIPDLHIPYHDGNAVDLIIKLKKNNKFDDIAISRFSSKCSSIRSGLMPIRFNSFSVY